MARVSARSAVNMSTSVVVYVILRQHLQKLIFHLFALTRRYICMFTVSAIFAHLLLHFYLSTVHEIALVSHTIFVLFSLYCEMGAIYLFSALLLFESHSDSDSDIHIRVRKQQHIYEPSRRSRTKNWCTFEVVKQQNDSKYIQQLKPTKRKNVRPRKRIRHVHIAKWNEMKWIRQSEQRHFTLMGHNMWNEP